MNGRFSRSCRTLSGAKGSIWLLVTMLACFVGLSTSNLQAQTQPAPAKSHRKVVVMVEPEYPAILRNGHFEGQVRLEATVLPNGNVSKVDIKGGNPMLSQYAQQAVQHWKYAPGPDKTIEEVTFNFNAH